MFKKKKLKESTPRIFNFIKNFVEEDEDVIECRAEQEGNHFVLCFHCPYFNESEKCYDKVEKK